MRLLLNLELQFLRVKNRKGNTENDRMLEKGQVVKSQDISSAIVMLMVFIFLFFFAGSLRDELLAFSGKPLFITYALNH